MVTSFEEAYAKFDSMMDELAKFTLALNTIHYMHDKYAYEK